MKGAVIPLVEVMESGIVWVHQCCSRTVLRPFHAEQGQRSTSLALVLMTFAAFPLALVSRVLHRWSSLAPLPPAQVGLVRKNNAVRIEHVEAVGRVPTTAHSEKTLDPSSVSADRATRTRAVNPKLVVRLRAPLRMPWMEQRTCLWVPHSLASRPCFCRELLDLC